MAHKLYRLYPARGVDNLGANEGHWDHLDRYCAMAFDAKDSNSAPLCSVDADDSLFVWSKESIDELKKKGGRLDKWQRDAVAYLWELCYDLLLARSNNVSKEPGYEAMGLRVNKK